MADTPALFTEWCPELERALAEPFPVELHMQKGGKGTFVSVHHYVARLNRLVGVHGWTMEPPQTFHAGNKLGMAVGVTILGVTKWNVGDEMEDHGEPDDDGKVRDFGSSCTNSWAQAAKRCLAYGFRMGLYLYDKDWTTRYLRKARNGNGNSQQSEPQRAPAQQRAPDQQDNGADSDVPPCPTCNGDMFDNRTDKTNPKAPDFRCKNANCKDDKGYRSALWLEKAS
jgi:hypothetical protein